MWADKDAVPTAKPVPEKGVVADPAHSPDHSGPSQPAFRCVGRVMLSPADLSRIVEMAWEDRTPFESIAYQFGLDESAVVRLMRTQMTASSFRMWRKRMAGRSTKHRKLQAQGQPRHRATNTRQA